MHRGSLRGGSADGRAAHGADGYNGVDVAKLKVSAALVESTAKMIANSSDPLRGLPLEADEAKLRGPRRGVHDSLSRDISDQPHHTTIGTRHRCM